MNPMQTSILLALVAVFIAAVAQILLKKAASRNAEVSFLRKFLNAPVILGYGMMFGSTFLNVIALRTMPLSYTPLTEATGYLWVPLLSLLVLKVRPTRRNMIGGIVIIVGMVMFALGA